MGVLDVVSKEKITLEEFERRYAGKRYEYVNGRALPKGEEIVGQDGELTVMSTKPKHGKLTHKLSLLIGVFVLEHQLGDVYEAKTGFKMGDNVRAADLAFVSRQRVAEIDDDEWIPFAPDLAVEVVSEYDKASDIRLKAREYMEYGTRLLLYVYPDSREIDVHRPGQPIWTLQIGDTLDGGDVLPGFSVPVAEIFGILDTPENR